jgi:UDP-N-acetylglucosamine 3-dehydrogenase
MNTVRLGIIGAGFMGGIHARVAAGLPGVEIVGVSDVDPARAAALAERYGGQPFAAHGAMLDSVQPDAVLVCTPETEHRQPGCDAARRGCHVFMEKPLASTLDDADAIIAACSAAGVQLMTGYILRFEACYAAMQAAIAQGQVGRVLTVYARRNATIEEGRRLTGRTTAINYLAVHDIDQMLWQRPERRVVGVRAHAVNGRLKAELGTSDFFWITMQFDDGSLGVVECGWAMTEGWGGFSDVKMNVIGTDGVLSLDFNPMNLIKVTRDQGWTYPETRHWPLVNDRPGGAVLLEISHFVECVRRGTQPLVSGTDGRRSLEITIAAEQSIAAGKEVSLPLV